MYGDVCVKISRRNIRPKMNTRRNGSMIQMPNPEKMLPLTFMNVHNCTIVEFQQIYDSRISTNLRQSNFNKFTTVEFQQIYDSRISTNLRQSNFNKFTTVEFQQIYYSRISTNLRQSNFNKFTTVEFQQNEA